MEDIPKKLGIDSGLFLKKYARWIPRVKKWSLIEKTVGEEFHCIFLESDNKCGIYDVRPTQCRTYPYWPGVMESSKTWNEEKPMCEGIDNETAPVCPAETITRILEEQIKDNVKTYEVGRHPEFEGKVKPLEPPTPGTPKPKL